MKYGLGVVGKITMNEALRCPNCGAVNTIAVVERSLSYYKVDEIQHDEPYFDYVRGDLIVEEVEQHELYCTSCETADIEPSTIPTVNLDDADVVRKIVDKMTPADLDVFVYNNLKSQLESGQKAVLLKLLEAWDVDV